MIIVDDIGGPDSRYEPSEFIHSSSLQLSFAISQRLLINTREIGSNYLDLISQEFLSIVSLDTTTSKS
jgi:hypothetical protein